MRSSYNAASLQLVLKETVNLFHKIETELESYISEGASPVLLDNIVELIHQIHGTLTIVDLPGATLLLDETKEAVSALENISADKKHVYFTSICHAIALIPKYLEFIKSKTDSLPYLLLPAINELRHRLGKRAITISYFFQFSSRPRIAIRKWDLRKMRELSSQGPDLLQKYQKALLSILTFGPEQHILIQMQDAIKEMIEICEGKPILELWILADLSLEAFISKEVAFTKPRRKLFAQIDRVFKAFIQDSLNNYNLRCPDAIIKELLYIIALTKSDSPNYQSVKEQYTLPESVATEKELLKEYLNFKGPSASALATAFQGMQEDIAKIIDYLNPSMINNSNHKDQVNATIEALINIGKILWFLGRAEGDIIIKQARLIKGILSTSDDDTLKKICNVVSLTLTQVNVSLARAMADPFSTRASPLDAAPQVIIIDTRQKAAFEDSRKYLRSARERLSDFIATREANHIKGVPQTLKLVCEGLTFVKFDVGASILYTCYNFVAKGLMNPNQKVTGKELTVLADAITGVDYYLECLLRKQPTPKDLLENIQKKISILNLGNSSSQRTA